MKNHHRWSKFWWQDYETDTALRACSLAAQGLWMRILCRMFDSNPHGTLVINGVPPTVKQLAAIVSASEKEVIKLMKELESAGVYSIENGMLYNRRMRRDQQLSERMRVYGKLGGNPVLKQKTTEKIATKNQIEVKGGAKLQEALKEVSKKDSPSLRSGPEPTASEFIDIRDQLWTTGPPLLRTLTGKPERSARSLLGKLLRTARDDCAVVLDALRVAVDTRPVDPVAWLTNACVGNRRNVEDRRAEELDLPSVADNRP